jgi:hypothetical protein
MLKLTKGQFIIINKAEIRSRKKNVVVHHVFKVLTKIIGAFKRDCHNTNQSQGDNLYSLATVDITRILN